MEVALPQKLVKLLTLLLTLLTLLTFLTPLTLLTQWFICPHNCYIGRNGLQELYAVRAGGMGWDGSHLLDCYNY